MEARADASSTGRRSAVVQDAKEVMGTATRVHGCVDKHGAGKGERRAAAKFCGYQVNENLMDLAPADALFMHCLPAHRGEEVTDEVWTGCSRGAGTAENRLHAHKAILLALMAGQEEENGKKR